MDSKLRKGALGIGKLPKAHRKVVACSALRGKKKLYARLLVKKKTCTFMNCGMKVGALNLEIRVNYQSNNQIN